MYDDKLQSLENQYQEMISLGITNKKHRKKTVLKFFQDECCFANLKKYLVNFITKNDGTYKNVDVSVLMDLERKETRLRAVNFLMVQYIENEVKDRIVKIIETNTQVGIDGYSIVSIYTQWKDNRYSDIIKRAAHDDLKYTYFTNPSNKIHVLDLLDNMELNELLSFYRFLYDTLTNINCLHEEIKNNKLIMQRQSDMLNNFYLLLNCKNLRNKTDHQNSILCDLRPLLLTRKLTKRDKQKKISETVLKSYIKNEFSKNNINIKRRSIDNRFDNPSIVEQITAIIVFFKLCNFKSLRSKVLSKLNKIYVNDFQKKNELYKSSQSLIGFFHL